MVGKSEKQDIDIKEEPLVLDGCRGRSDPVVTREGRTWLIEVDTCFGHASERLGIVPGIERRAGESESEEEEAIGPEDRARLKALFLSAGQKTRLMTITSGMMKKPPMKIAQVTMVQLMEEEDEFEPALNIPMFSPLRHGPPPEVETNEEEAVEQQRTRQYKRPSVFDSITSSATGSAPLSVGDGGIDMNALATLQSEDEDDDDSPDLLEGFGQRPQKRTVSVRKFVRRNKFLKKVFRGSSSNNNMQDVSISDDHFGK
jgi:hypothetical protein